MCDCSTGVQVRVAGLEEKNNKLKQDLTTLEVEKNELELEVASLTSELTDQRHKLAHVSTQKTSLQGM